MKQTLIAASLALAFGSSAVQAASLYNWTDATPPITNIDETISVKNLVSGSFSALYVNTNNVNAKASDLSIKFNVKNDESNKNNPLNGLYFTTGRTQISGLTLTIDGTTDIAGGGDNRFAAIYFQQTDKGLEKNLVADISADVTNISMVSTAANGKSVYGVATYSGVLNFTGKEVNINLETSTVRTQNVNKMDYSEVAGIEASYFGSHNTRGTVTSSESTVINIDIQSLSESKTQDSIGTNGSYQNERGGASPAYGLKVEGGAADLRGTLNVKTTTIGADSYGVKVTNEMFNTSLDTVDAKASTSLGTVNIESHSKTGNAYGINVDRTKVSDDNTVLLKVSGPLDVKATTESGTATGLDVKGSSSAELNGNLTVSATAVTGTATAVRVATGSLDINGQTNSITGDVALTSAGTLAFGTNSKTTVDGSVTTAKGTSLKLDSAELELAAGNTATISGTLTSNNGTVVLNEVAAGSNKVLTVAGLSGNLAVASSGALNDTFASPEEAAAALQKSVSITTTGESSESSYSLTGKSGTISDAWTANSEGKVTQRTQNESLNAFENFNAMTLVAWRGENNHLTQRLGDIRDNAGSIGAWARVYGYDAKYSDVVSIKYKSNSIQAGADFRFADNYVAGAAFSYSDGEGDFSNGSADAESYTLAAYLSGFFPCGGYFDVIGRAGRLSTDITAANQTNLMQASYDNTVLGLSAEIGWRYDITSMFYVEPQAELSYAVALGDDFTASNGVKVDQDDYQSLVGRLGARLGANFADKKGSVYLTASVNHDFLGDADSTAKLGNVVRDQSVDAGGTWVSYGLGAQFNTTENLSFYGSLEKASGSEYREDYRYNVGLRYVW